MWLSIGRFLFFAHFLSSLGEEVLSSSLLHAQGPPSLSFSGGQLNLPSGREEAFFPGLLDARNHSLAFIGCSAPPCLLRCQSRTSRVPFSVSFVTLVLEKSSPLFRLSKEFPSLPLCPVF